MLCAACRCVRREDLSCRVPVRALAFRGCECPDCVSWDADGDRAALAARLAALPAAVVRLATLPLALVQETCRAAAICSPDG